MLARQTKEDSSSLLDKLRHGLSGRPVDVDGDAPVDLREPRGVAIRIDGVNKSFGAHHVLKDVSLDVSPGETFSIIGPSGTGKSVLLKLIVRLEMPDSGQIFVDSRPLFSDGGLTALPDFRYSMVFQSSALFNSLTVGENVGLWLREKRVCTEPKVQQIIADKLAMVGLAGKEHLRTWELSGGMKKRVAIARSLAMSPDLILYDEPTAELDPVTSDELANTILTLKETVRNTTVVVTHDLNFALYISDRIAMIHDGQIIEVGRPAEIKASANPLVRRFIYTTTKGIKEE